MAIETTCIGAFPKPSYLRVGNWSESGEDAGDEHDRTDRVLGATSAAGGGLEPQAAAEGGGDENALQELHGRASLFVTMMPGGRL